MKYGLVVSFASRNIYIHTDSPAWWLFQREVEETGEKQGGPVLLDTDKYYEVCETKWSDTGTWKGRPMEQNRRLRNRLPCK